MSSTSKLAAEYVGDGEFLGGIPGRDLTEEDVAALEPAQRGLLHASPLYKLHGTALKADAKEEAIKAGLVEPDPEPETAKDEKPTRNSSESPAHTSRAAATTATSGDDGYGKGEAARATHTGGSK